MNIRLLNVKLTYLIGFSLVSGSLPASFESKSSGEMFSEAELEAKDREVRIAAFKTGTQIAGTAAAVALTPAPANLLVGAAGACSVHDSYKSCKEAENDLAKMRAHNERVADAKERARESVRDQRFAHNAQRSGTSFESMRKKFKNRYSRGQ
jgi:hypothetical protein